MKDYFRVEAEIDLSAIEQNIFNVKKLLKPETKLMIVIKADGYGHGAFPVAKVLDPVADAYGVAILEEGLTLRRIGIKKPILILGFTPEQQYQEMVEKDIMTAVFTYDMAEGIAEEAKRQKKTAKIHIKIDTGMGRIGFQPSEASIATIKRISALENLQIDGIFTHFAKADEKDKTYFEEQFAKYQWVCRRLSEEGVEIPVHHVANSASIMELPKAQLDMVRSGIITYGLYPSDEVDASLLALHPAMSMRATVSFVKQVPAGSGIGYGISYITKSPARIATVPVGYADGYSRALSNRGFVLIHGKRAPIVGRICMDQFMVDVTHIPDVCVGDVVTLLGKDGNAEISAEELSAWAGSFNYELICDVSKRVPRVYYYQGKKVGTLDYYNCENSVFDLML